MQFILVIVGVFLKFLVVSAMPENVISFQRAAEKFQESVQQQTFESVLIAIEDRLRNLDNIYTMQLSETLKSKLDQYSRKLDVLDTKLIRLESMAMLNLNQISENISNKNYKDDLAKTQLYKKLETFYEGLSHRMNYVDRKIEIGFDKIQSKVDSTLQRLERMEEDMIQRNSDIESELSETLSTLEDYRSSIVKTDKILINISNSLESTVQGGHMLREVNFTVNNMFLNLTRRFNTLENTPLVTDMKKELKNDFNSYANKVSDMNMEIWKRNDLMEERLKIMETAVNATRIEVQNGMRALMVQIGKSSGKVIPVNDINPEESWRKYVNISLEKLLLNQDLFLESCHRVQMDESQIESEISQTLGKLIDMLETKMTTVMKDLKSLDKTVKNHDSKAHRNLNQANTNIISLFEKSVLANDNTAKELQDIKFYINSLFTYLQDVLPKRRGKKIEDVLSDVSSNVSIMINLFDSWNKQMKNQPSGTTDLTQIIPTFTKHLNLSEDMHKTLKEIKMTIMDLQNHINKSSDNSSTLKTELPKRKCVQNYRHLIDVRGDFTICNETVEDDVITHQNQEKVIWQNPSSTTTEKVAHVETNEDLSKVLIEIFGTPPPLNAKNITTNKQNQDFKTTSLNSLGLSSTTEKVTHVENNEDLSKVFLEIFGAPPPSNAKNTTTNKQNQDLKTTTLNSLDLSSTTKKMGTKDDCIPQWANFINIRAGVPNAQETVNCTSKVKKNKTKKKRRKQIQRPIFTSRFNVDDDQNVENTEGDEYDEDVVSTEINTENILFTSTEVDYTNGDSSE
ncbi:myosin-7-like [Anthonomus grandis grandis]|uniref:myosin-7-like n=1 Tax=Anthonomus grandis grandis TaxID=2921223 RepID=UPI0021656A53|nr:myosin-7-like [Anthonomus grandis grandis]